jgi:glycosyltransferase involved in cell wall biosynthesis
VRRLLFVGLLVPRKGVHLLLEAFAAADLPRDVVLSVVGDGPERDALEAQRVRLGLQDRVELLGFRSDVPALLTAADAFVLDSFFEGGPIVSMEALVAGLPVVISDVGAAREQLGPQGQRGYVVPNPLGEPLDVDVAAVRAARYQRHANHDALVVAMSTVVKDRSHWAAVREQLRRESIRRFHPDSCLRGHAAALARAADRLPLLAALPT